jgi:hypothetical protein
VACNCTFFLWGDHCIVDLGCRLFLDNIFEQFIAHPYKSKFRDVLQRAMESCVSTQKQWVDMTLVLVGIWLLLWIPLSTCCNICEADLQMNCSICRSLHPTGCSFHNLHAPNSAVLVFNFHSWTLFVVCVYHHLLCQHSRNHLLSGEMDRCVTGATKLPCLEGTPQMLANRSVTGEGLSKVTRVLQRLLAWERKLWLAICLANTY